MLGRLQEEFGEHGVPLTTLYGRVVEYADMSVGELQRIVTRLVGRRVP